MERLKGNHKRADWAWRWSKELFQFGFDNGFIVVKDGRNGKRIYTKTYQQVTIEKNGNDYQIVEKERIKPVQSIQLIENCFSNDNAKKELGTIFEEIPFDYPKPTSIMHYMLQTIPECSTILDFFAGSGTTLHATMQLNAEDGGHRKCILVTNNENNICEEVTYERNKCVINGYTTPKGEEVAGLKNNTMRYYRTSFVGRSRNMKNMRQLMNLSTDMLCIKEDLYTEQTKFGEQPTYKNVFRYFDDGKKRMMIIYKEEAVLLLADLIRKTDYEGKMRVYVFSPSEDPWEGEFEEVQDKVQLCALPQAIYNAYKRILPKKKDITLEQENNAASNDDKAFNGMLNFDEEEDEQ